MSLDNIIDTELAYFGRLIQQGVNDRLSPFIAEDAIRYVFGAPFPLGMIPHNRLPCLVLSRSEERDLDRGYAVFESVRTFAFSYYAPAAPLERMEARWKLLQAVWYALLGIVREGRDLGYQDEYQIPTRDLRYVLASGSVRYGVMQDDSNVVCPRFQGEAQFTGEYPTPESFFDSYEKYERLDDLERIGIKWRLMPRTNWITEAEEVIELEAVN